MPEREIVGPTKILLVDDRRQNLMSLEAALSQPGYELVSVDSGREALDRVRADSFAIVLLDVQMPGLNGFETARLIRQESSVPIIFITAIDHDETYEVEAYAAGAVDYLFKPINPEILRAKVEVFADIHRKNAEIRRQAQVIRARDEFLSIASHELKTPITPLALQLELFRELATEGRLHSLDKDRLSRMLDNSFAQVERLTRLVDDLLDVSRITAGRLQLTPERIDLGAVAARAIESLAVEATRVGAPVKLDAQADVVGEWDPFRLEQVLFNLLTNALKYGLGKPVEVQVFRQNAQAELVVRDQGIGISLEDQSRIFDRFERAVSARHFGGLGLGLYIARQIAELHGGSIGVESIAGQGSTFRVRLPCA